LPVVSDRLEACSTGGTTAAGRVDGVLHPHLAAVDEHRARAECLRDVADHEAGVDHRAAGVGARHVEVQRAVDAHRLGPVGIVPGGAVEAVVADIDVVAEGQGAAAAFLADAGGVEGARAAQENLGIIIGQPDAALEGEGARAAGQDPDRPAARIVVHVERGAWTDVHRG